MNNLDDGTLWEAPKVKQVHGLVMTGDSNKEGFLLPIQYQAQDGKRYVLEMLPSDAIALSYYIFQAIEIARQQNNQFVFPGTKNRLQETYPDVLGWFDPVHLPEIEDRDTAPIPLYMIRRAENYPGQGHRPGAVVVLELEQLRKDARPTERTRIALAFSSKEKLQEMMQGIIDRNK